MDHRSREGWRVHAVAIAVLASTAGRALAQSAEPTPAAAEPETTAAESHRTIEEIVVTAQKTEQNLRDVPISVTAVTGEAIRDKALNDLTEVSHYVPNVRVDTDDPGSPQVFIRGFGTNTFNPSFEPSVGFVEDDIFFSRSSYFTESMFDVQRIEVLRGPQGTLFGKNTVAGVYNVVTNSPTKELSADLGATFGSFGERRFEGGAGGMAIDSLGARAAFLDWRRDGRLENTTLDRKEDELRQQAGRLKVKILPTDSLDVDLAGSVSDTSIPFWPFELQNLDSDTRSFLQGYDPRVEDDPFDFRTSMDTVGFLDKGSDTISAKATWDAGDVGPIRDSSLVLVLGRSDLEIRQLSDLDVSPADISRLHSAEDARQHSLELRAHGMADGIFGWGHGLEAVGGVFLFRTSYHLRARVAAGNDLSSYLLTNDALLLGSRGAAPNLSIQPLPRGVIPPLGPIVGEDYYNLDFQQTTTTVAPFGQLTWDIGPFSITPGVRINWESKDADATGRGVCASKDVTGTCVMETVIGANDYALLGAKRDEFDVSPKISALYHWGDDVSLYASWAKGFKSGGVNAISLTGAHLMFEPENAKTIEVGAKGKLLDDTLQVNLALYRTKFDNLQVLAFNGVFLDVKNAAKATSQGAELETEWLTPYEPLTLTGSLGLLHARYDEYEGAPAPVGNGIGTLQDLSGKRIAFAPDETATVTPALAYHVYRGWPLTLAFDVQYVGTQFTDTDLDPHTRVPAHAVYAVRGRLGGDPEVWSVTFGVKDLTDERVLNQVTDAVFFPGTFYAQQEPARVFFGSLRFTW